MSLASRDSGPEDVVVVPVVIPKLKLGDVERQIFGADFVERADDAALEDRPEAFDGLSVYRANNILASGVINDAMRIVSKVLITNPLIGAGQANLCSIRPR